MSRQKESQLALLSVHMPYEEAKKVYQELTHLEVGRMTAHRTIQRLGAKALKVRETPQPVVSPSKEGISKKHLTADGTMVHIREEGWKEAKVGASYEVDGARRAGNVAYVATLGERTGLGERLYALAGEPKLEETHSMAFVSDAAEWLGEIQKLHFPLATPIVDFWHAAQYVWKVADGFYGQGTPKARQWAEDKIRLLKEGAQRRLRMSLSQMKSKTKEQREILKKTQRYFRNHGYKMDYPHYEQMGFHIGSGVAEAACKHVIQSRFKQAGMRWSRPGAENLLRLRVAYLNHHWNQVAECQRN